MKEYRNEDNQVITECEFCEISDVELGVFSWDLEEGYWMICEKCAIEREAMWEPA